MKLLKKTTMVIALAAALTALPENTASVQASSLGAGSQVLFGNYQTGISSSYGNEALSWTVLGEQGDYVLLLCDLVVDEQPYTTDLSEITWENCDIRAWLNETFLYTAFSEEERGSMAYVEVPDANAGGTAVQDMVFLLSENELSDYFGEVKEYESNSSLVCGATPYAGMMGVATDDEGNGGWWCRNTGAAMYKVPYVECDGSIVTNMMDANTTQLGVRPAISVQKSALQSSGSGESGVVSSDAGAESLEISMNHYYADSKEYGCVEARGSDGNVCWTYQTEGYAAAQLNRVSGIGECNGKYYLSEDGTIVALDVQSGAVLWKNSDFGGSVSAYLFDRADNSMYICGYLSPDLFHISFDGETIERIESVNSEYYWPVEINLAGDNQVEIRYDHAGGEQSGTLVVNVTRG